MKTHEHWPPRIKLIPRAQYMMNVARSSSPVVRAICGTDRCVFGVVDQPFVGGVQSERKVRHLGTTEIRAVGIQVPGN